MSTGYISLPFRPEAIIQGRELQRTNRLDQAITEHLHVVLRTAPGEAQGDPGYGCRIWEHMADRVRGEAWMARLKEDVRQAVVNCEPRLVEVEVELKQGTPGRNELQLAITGRTVPGGKPYRLSSTILTDPMRLTT